MSKPVILPGGARSIMSSRREPPDSLDLFLTPPWATRGFCEVLRARGLAGMWDSAWDPCCGQGHMSGPLHEYFDKVTASDVFPHGGVREEHPPGWWRVLDFLDEAEPAPEVDWILANPPFKASVAFALRALSLAKKGAALLLRTGWVDGHDRYRDLFEPHPPRLIVQYAERVPMARGRWDPDGSTATPYAWFVWAKDRFPGCVGVQREPSFIWLPPVQKKRFHTAADVERYATLTPAPLLEAVDETAREGEGLCALA